VPDQNGVLRWLAHELQQAEDANEMVFIVGHIHTGHGDMMGSWSIWFDGLVQRYRDTVRVPPFAVSLLQDPDTSSQIANQFYGHSHRGEFGITYTDPNNHSLEAALTMSFIGPSITTASGNPAFRVYDIDPDTFQVMDFTEFIADVQDPAFDEGPEWKPFYSAREEYTGLLDGGWPEDEPLDARFWHLVVDAFDRDPEALRRYQRRMLRYTDDREHKGLCHSDRCRKAVVCQLRKSVSADPCKPMKAGLNIDASGRRQQGVPWAAEEGVYMEEAGVEGDDEGDEEEEVHHTHVDAGLILRDTARAALSGKVSPPSLANPYGTGTDRLWVPLAGCFVRSAGRTREGHQADIFL
jgi:sphingomyelin phosphodiesterase